MTLEYRLPLVRCFGPVTFTLARAPADTPLILIRRPVVRASPRVSGAELARFFAEGAGTVDVSAVAGATSNVLAVSPVTAPTAHNRANEPIPLPSLTLRPCWFRDIIAPLPIPILNRGRASGPS